MNEAKHTPGPWQVDAEQCPDDFGAPQRDGTRAHMRQYVRHSGPLGGRICCCFSNCLVTTDDELHANARLIAAAPDLLAALKVARGYVDDHQGRHSEAALQAVDAAIARATSPT
jgi:hypothetical protein